MVAEFCPTSFAERDPETGRLVGFAPGIPSLHAEAEDWDGLVAALRALAACQPPEVPEVLECL